MAIFNESGLKVGIVVDSFKQGFDFEQSKRVNRRRSADIYLVQMFSYFARENVQFTAQIEQRQNSFSIIVSIPMIMGNYLRQ